MPDTSGPEAIAGGDAPAAAPPARLDPVDEIIYRHAMWVTLASGFPVPGLDVVVVLGFQLRMVRALCRHYGVPFEPHRVRALLAALLSGLATEGVARGPFVHMVTRAIPPVNIVATLVKAYIPFKLGIVVAGGATYAVGRAFAAHLADGALPAAGSVTFQQYFRDQLQAGLRRVRAAL